MEAFEVVLLEHQLRHFLEKTDLLEEQLNVQLLPTLHSALVEPFHRLPLQRTAEDFEDLEEAVAEEDHKVEVLWAVGTHVFLAEGSIPELNFVAEFIVDAEKDEENHYDSEESSDIRQSIIEFLEAPFDRE